MYNPHAANAIAIVMHPCSSKKTNDNRKSEGAGSSLTKKESGTKIRVMSWTLQVVR